jgi:hypothetical protein
LDGDKVILDLVREWRAPFSPDQVIEEMVFIVRKYSIEAVIGDNFAAEFCKAAFESRGIQYERVTSNPWSNSAIATVAKPKSQLYLELLPRLCSGEIELLDNEVLISQLAGLERRTRVGGRDLIDHGPGQKDDVANSVAGVVVVAAQAPRGIDAMSGWGDSPAAVPVMKYGSVLQDILDHERNLASSPNEPPNWNIVSHL